MAFPFAVASSKIVRRSVVMLVLGPKFRTQLVQSSIPFSQYSLPESTSTYRIIHEKAANKNLKSKTEATEKKKKERYPLITEHPTETV